MRFKNVSVVFAAAAIILTPVAASANPAAALSLGSVAAQDTEAETAGSGGVGTGTVVGILFALVAISIGVASGGDDSPSSP